MPPGSAGVVVLARRPWWLGVRGLRELRPPRRGLLGLAPRLVETDQAVARLGQVVGARRYFLRPPAQALVTGQDQGFGVGVFPLRRQALAQAALGVEAIP